MIKVDSYANGSYPFPNSEVDPNKKDAKYCSLWAKAIYSLYCKNGTAFGGYSGVDYFNRMRRYSNGNQDTTQYFSFIKNESFDETGSATAISIYDDNLFTKEAKRSGYHALMFQNLSPAPKILNSLHGLLDKLDYDIMADTIDADSRGLIEFEKYKKFHEARDAEWQIKFKQKAGLPIDQPTNFPKTKEELDAFEAREGFKLNVAKAMQKLLRHSFNISKWDSVTRKKVVDDLITTGFGTTEDYFDKETNEFKAKWADPQKTVLQYSDEYDYNDSEYGGVFSTMTISNLRKELPYLTDEELVSLAKSYVGRFDNPAKWDDSYSVLDPNSGNRGFDGWKVCIFKAYWIDNDTHKSIYWKGKGNERILPIGFDSKVKPLTESQKARNFKQEIKSTNLRQVYQCTWVVDSDYCFDYGKYYMGARPNMTKPKLPIHAEQLLQPSIIYRLIPIFDHIAITWLQFQNDLANMIQRGYAINMGMLMNITMNGKDLDPASVISMWKRKGLLPYMPGALGRYEGGMPTPITPIEGGLGKRVEETSMALQMYYKSIEDIVGINPLSLGATPDPNAPVSTSEAAVRATGNVIKPIIDALFELKQSLAESISLRLQIGLRVNKSIRQSYSGVVSPSDIRTMIIAESSGTKYGITLRARPDDKQRLNIIRFMELALSQGQIGADEAMYFSERIESGADITDIRQELSYSIQKNAERVQKEKLEAVDRQNQGLAQIEQMKAQNAAQQSMLDANAKIAEEQKRAEAKALLLRLENNYKVIADIRNGMMAEKGLTTANTSK